MNHDSSGRPAAVQGDDQIDQPEIHTHYVETYGRALLAAKGAAESVKWLTGRAMTAATTIAISDALAGRKVKTPTELVRALRTVLEIGAINYADLDRRVTDLDVSIAAVRALEEQKIRFVGELARLSVAEARRLFRIKRTKELAKGLAEINMGFGTDVGDWVPPRIAEDNPAQGQAR